MTRDDSLHECVCARARACVCVCVVCVCVFGIIETCVKALSIDVRLRIDEIDAHRGKYCLSMKIYWRCVVCEMDITLLVQSYFTHCFIFETEHIGEHICRAYTYVNTRYIHLNVLR